MEGISLVLKDTDENKIHTVNGGHPKSFCVEVLDIIKSSERRNSQVKLDAGKWA